MRLSKRLKIACMMLAMMLFLWLGSSAVVTWKLTRRSAPQFAESASGVSWGTVEEHRLTTCDGQQIGAWLVRGAPQRGCVLLLHGNGGSRTSMRNVMRLLAAEQLTVMSISLRAHGDSTGEINDFGWSARHDVVEAVRFLETEFPGRPVYVVGRSLGAAAALFAAETLSDRVAGYLIEQPYTDLASATWNRLDNYLPPVLDWIAYGGMRSCAIVLFPIDPSEIAPADRLRSIPKQVPVTIATGSADRHARLTDVRQMFQQVADHARLVVFDGAEHVNLDAYDPKLYRKVLLELVADDVIAEPD